MTQPLFLRGTKRDVKRVLDLYEQARSMSLHRWSEATLQMRLFGSTGAVDRLRQGRVLVSAIAQMHASLVQFITTPPDTITREGTKHD